MTNDWIYKLHIAIWLKKVSNDRLFANLQFCDFLIKVSYCSVHYRLHCTTFTRTHRQQFFKKDVKWLNLQTSHCNLTEKCHKRQTSCDFLLKLLTAVSTYIFAATAFTQTSGQQFLRKMSNDWIFKLHIAIWQKNVSNDKLLAIFFTKVTYCCVHFRFRCCCFYSNPWAAILANVWCAWWPFRLFQFFQSSHDLFWDNLKVSNGKGRPNNYSFDHVSVFQ